MSPINEQKKALKDTVTELEETLATLKHKLHHDEEVNQHDAVEHLEEYLSAVDHKYSSLKAFLNSLRKELSGSSDS